TVMNGSGRDFKIFGNASSFGNSEPGIIEVAWDKNGNGAADEDEWYQIAGSEYHKDSTIKNYAITYEKPSAELDEETREIENYIHWKDNQGHEGFIKKNKFHHQSYYPGWATKETLTFRGTKIADNYTKQGGFWKAEP